MRNYLVQFRVDTELLERVTEPQAVQLLHESLLYSAQYLRRRAQSLESLEFVAMDEAAEFVGHLSDAAKGAYFLKFETVEIEDNE